jgi:hypothetical protein
VTDPRFDLGVIASACATFADHISYDRCRGIVWPFCHEVEVPAHSLRCRKERGGEIEARPTGQLGRREGIPERTQIFERALVRGQRSSSPTTTSS